MSTLPPIPTRLPKAQVHAFAESIAQRLDFSRKDAFEPLVVRLGGRIDYKTADTSLERLPESIVVRSFSDFTIYLPSVTSVVRDRFTVAHELGHLFLHYPMIVSKSPGAIMRATRWVNENDQELQRAEWEANWFAAAFLMPSNEFSKLYKANGKSVEITALDFKVSSRAVAIRAETLGL